MVVMVEEKEVGMVEVDLVKVRAKEVKEVEEKEAGMVEVVEVVVEAV
jgi:hypothetical protein